jgi:hypothetical protein
MSCPPPLTFTAPADLLLAFDLLPAAPEDDLDFVLYELPEGDCAPESWGLGFTQAATAESRPERQASPASSASPPSSTYTPPIPTR